MLDYAAALQLFNNGSWPDAQKLLARWSKDGPSKFLLSYIEEHGSPPEPWDGVIRLASK
jgi:hypothetical protein